MNTLQNIYYQKAIALHQQVPVIDAHNDLAGELLLRHQHGERDVIQRLYLADWKAAGFHLIVSSIYIENTVFFPTTNSSANSQLNAAAGSSLTWNDYWEQQTLCWEQGFANALEQIQCIKEEIHELSEELCLVTSYKEWEEVKKRKKIGILLYMEGLDCIGDDISKIHTLYELGVRGASLTWSRPNLLATGCCTAGKFTDIPGKITELGFHAIMELQRHHMFVDISHLNNEGWAQLNAYYTDNQFTSDPHFHNPITDTAESQGGGFQTDKPTLPYIATHSNAYDVFPNYRNLTCPQMKALAQQGGIMGFNACKYIVGCKNPEDYLNQMCEHIEYVVRTIGDHHVGFGFDLCDSYTSGKYQNPDIEPEDCLNNYKEALLLTARLLERGMTEQTVLRIISLNWLEYFEKMMLPSH